MTSLPKDINLPVSPTRNATKSILIITGNKVEDLEFFYPYYRFLEEGYRVDVATPEGGTFKGKHEISLSQSKPLTEVNAADYDMLYLPGGQAPATLRDNPQAIALTKAFVEAHKPVAAVCHGPQILAAANVIKGATISGYPEIEKEVTGAGATFSHDPVVTSGLFTTARIPGDLPAHLKAALKALNTASQPATRKAA